MGLLSHYLTEILFLSSVLAAAWTVKGNIQYHEFFVKETNFTLLCDAAKSISTVNDSFPGPVIRAHKGDLLYINVYNEGLFGITMHWHGVKLPGNPWADGPDHITQCQIQPGTNFTYEVQLSEEEGTLWWHAHSDWTRATVHGAIVIIPIEGTTYPFPEPDEEQVLIFGNWFRDNLTELIEWAYKNGSDTPSSDAYTINGLPGDFSPCASNDTIFRMVVDPGKTYLLRMVNALNNADLFFAIADHNLTVVGADGAYTKPLVSDFILLSTGRSMDVLVTANQKPSHYYMAARQYSSDQPEATDFDQMNVTAVFEYTGNYTSPAAPYFPSSLPVYKDNYAGISFTARLRSLGNQEHPVNVPQNITTRMYLVASMGMILCPNASCGGIYGNRLVSSLNNVSWIDPSLSVLEAYYRNISGVYKTNFPNYPANTFNYTGEDLDVFDLIPVVDTRVKVLEYGEAVEIVLQGTYAFGQEHPIHLHGYSFYVVGSGPGNFDEETDPQTFNLIDPPYLNMVAVPRYGWAAIRFFANNPGAWYLHCHYDRHMSWGMNTVLIVKNGNTTETSMRSPADYMPACPGPVFPPPPASGSLKVSSGSDGKENYSSDK